MKDPLAKKIEKPAHLADNDAAREEGAEFAQLREQLRAALPPLQQTRLRRDLWPDMLRRMEKEPVRVPWFDWVLLATAGAAMAFFPALIPELLYHL